ncbi:uncharacterized protein LOC125151220 [Prionailurus viverrinus]|uniref:uncharacterized protein LOC125151220 n=1 Tax=Prionailurus viverrinus TaxID=61388 RepID=UPI001FF0E6DB|nr:uncharacterized protein LOC125151220 [Prionailurus viverrinus]
MGGQISVRVPAINSFGYIPSRRTARSNALFKPIISKDEETQHLIKAPGEGMKCISFNQLVVCLVSLTMKLSWAKELPLESEFMQLDFGRQSKPDSRLNLLTVFVNSNLGDDGDQALPHRQSALPTLVRRERVATRGGNDGLEEKNEISLLFLLINISKDLGALAKNVTETSHGFSNQANASAFLIFHCLHVIDWVLSLKKTHLCTSLRRQFLLPRPPAPLKLKAVNFSSLGIIFYSSSYPEFSKEFPTHDGRRDLAKNPKACSIHFTAEFTFQQNNSRMNHCTHRLLVMPGLKPIFKALFYFVFKAKFAEIYVEISYSS